MMKRRERAAVLVALALASVLVLAGCGSNADKQTKPKSSTKTPVAAPTSYKPIVPADADVVVQLSTDRSSKGALAQADDVAGRLPAWLTLRDDFDLGAIATKYMQQQMGIAKSKQLAWAGDVRPWLGDACGGAMWLGKFPHAASSHPRWMIWCGVRKGQRDAALKAGRSVAGDKLARILDDRVVVTSDVLTMGLVAAVVDGGADAVEESAVWKASSNDGGAASGDKSVELGRVYVNDQTAMRRLMFDHSSSLSSMAARLIGPLSSVTTAVSVPVIVRAGVDRRGAWATMMTPADSPSSGERYTSGSKFSHTLKSAPAQLIERLPIDTVGGVVEQSDDDSDDALTTYVTELSYNMMMPGVARYLVRVRSPGDVHAAGMVDDQGVRSVVEANGDPLAKHAKLKPTVTAFTANKATHAAALAAITASWQRGVDALRGLDRVQQEFVDAGVPRKVHSAAWFDPQSLVALLLEGSSFSSSEQDVIARQFTNAQGPIAWTVRDGDGEDARQVTHVRLLLDR